ncbi:eIF-2-alpha kinase GCN2 [Aricia agestis]|uniref:eIF-2-alpha kinase GCN2 n=1 Tax=Aricia agestis TaxID=91739 RepID=UPI001C2031F3|nr:eIF-2-alpha kinase GCN2 [Aricia agestis]
MCEETNQERQNNELVALEAIFGDAVVDDRKKVAWNGWSPNNIVLSLQPLHNSDGIHSTAVLQFKCCKSYPEKPPQISIVKAVGLSDENVKKLLNELDVLAEQLCGEVMIFQLAQYTQQFLHEHNKPILSFYEEMIRQKNEKEKLKQQNELVRENEELKKVKDEIQKRQEELRDGKRVRLSSLHQEEDVNGHGDDPKLVYYADNKASPAKSVPRARTSVPCTCNAKGAQVLRHSQRNNKKLYMGNCIGHSSNGSTTYLAIDDDGERIIAKKWILQPATDFQTRNRQITTLQNELKAMCRVRHHSLVPYIAMEMSMETKRTARQFIYIFRNFVLGTSLKFLQNKSSCGDKFEALRLLRHVGLGVMSALKELHNLNLLHRDVRYENVFLEDGGAVKLVGASLDARLVEMIDGENVCDKQTKAQDIFAAAQMLLSIISKDSVHEIPSDLPVPAKDFFSRCLTEDEHAQWSAEQLAKHAFLIDAPQNAPSTKENNVADGESEDESAPHNIQGINSLLNGHSRLNAEFEVLMWLGKGAFGDVLKVKNKLDGGFYAIKHVKLNPKSVELNKKITREVKLLSRLNHENVVRYYNAWIETSTASDVEESNVVKTPIKKEDSLLEVVAKLGQDVKVNWSMSDGPVQVRDESSDSDDSSDDEPDLFFNIMRPEDESSTGIEFEQDSDNKSMTITTEDTISPSPALKQVLYIQMEFCEKNTLRQAIDNGLYQEHFRAWRLFREILEGLSHVHQKGMIHRDLKPVNIFLDSNDHVKIGDFGLATKCFTGLPVQNSNPSQDEVDGLLTGKVGTTLYVAPELQQSTTKVMYNQKVDIYSLGIILFEMFHQPFDTGTERCTVLMNLRKKKIIMPEDFVKDENSKQIHVLRWLLDHDPSARPTSAELLSSSHVPRAVPEGALAGLLQHTLSQRGSRPYQRLVAACLDQKPSAAEDFLYHSAARSKPMDAIGAIKDAVIEVFKSHGAKEFSPPLLMPRAERWDQYPNAVRLMTFSGYVCHLPHDLRLPFARYIAYTATKYMRRYVVERVYRETERSASGFHPREIIECAFDIVAPRTDSFWSDAELLVVASRVAMANSLKVTIQMNHTDLLKTLLIACGVPQDKHAGLYPVLVDVSLGRITQLQLQTHLATLCLPDRDAANLLRLMEADVAPEAARALLHPLRTRRAAAQERALRQLQNVATAARALGCTCPITIAPLLAYNATQHSGVFWQMLVVRNDTRPTPKHRSKDLIAVGGRYDNLVQEFWRVARAENDNTELRCTSVGFSLSLERMAAIIKSMEVEVPSAEQDSQSNVSCVVVSAVTTAAEEQSRLPRLLWGGGVRAQLWAGPARDARDVTRASLVLEHEGAYVLVSCWEGTRVREHKVLFSEILDFVKQKLRSETVRSPEYGNRSISWNESDKSNSPTMSITFITARERITKNSKRHCEVQINNQIASLISQLGMGVACGRIRVSVLALACEGACVRLLASHLGLPLIADQLASAFRPASDAFPKLHNILDEALHELMNLVKQSNQNRSEEVQLYALYSIPDSVCKIIV